MSVTSLNQYSISQQSQNLNSNNSNHNKGITPTSNTITGANSQTEGTSELKKDIFKKGFNLSNANANIPKNKAEGPRGEYKDRDSEDVSMDDDIDKKEPLDGVSKEDEPKEGGRIKMKISSLVS